MYNKNIVMKRQKSNIVIFIFIYETMFYSFEQSKEDQLELLHNFYISKTLMSFFYFIHVMNVNNCDCLGT